MVESEKVEACMAQQVLRASRCGARRPGSTLDSCAIEDLGALLKDPQAGLAAAFRRVAQHASFFMRKVGPQ